MHGAPLTADAPPRDAFFQTVRGAGIRSADTPVHAELDGRTLADAPCTLYDMRADPFQYDSLAGGAAHPLFARLQTLDRRFAWSDLQDDPR